MRFVCKVNAMQRLGRQWQQAGKAVVLVPTMGSLHRGHVRLMERARQWAGRKGRVVVSVYVNPRQFGPREDFAAYPRDLKGDQRLCRAAGVDVFFAPGDAEMYPADFSTAVEEGKLAGGMEGAARPGHFRGVTTIVAKLFNVVLPAAAVFGAKDFQQAAVIRRMTRDLNFPVKIVVAPTLREADGLALSSRNQYLSPAQREQAVVLWRAIERAQETVARRPAAAARLRRETARMVAAQPGARLDYVEFFDPATLEPVRMAKPGTHMALAVFVGRTRLIDNGRL
ncbi:MAG: pantoate--beta-alanine ligase [Verrucomicrobiota bacterium]